MSANECGCGCGGSTGLSGVPPANRPGLARIDYRRGQFGSFRRALLDELASTPGLSALHSRLSSDYTVTLLDLWSVVADVIAFYTERTANEAFLRTATTRDSLLRLVRLIDYHLAPGLAAQTLLSFILEPNASAEIRAGTKVQSVPAQGATPQKYETIEDLHANGRLNALPIVAYPAPDSPRTQGHQDAVTAADPDAVAQAMALRPGDRVVFYTHDAYELREVASRTIDGDMVKLSWDRPISADGFDYPDGNPLYTGVRRLGRTFRLFGHDAPPQTVVSRLRTAGDPTTAFLVVATTVYGMDTPALEGRQIDLDVAEPGLSPGAVVLVISEPATLVIPCVVVKVDSVVTSLPSTLPATVPVSAADPAPTVASGHTQRLTLKELGGDLVWLAGIDLRGVSVVEMLGEPLRFWPHRNPSRITGATVYVQGRRSGWSTLEVGRSIEKGKLVAGVDIGLDLLAPGRRVVASDQAGQVTPATISRSSILGSQVSFSDAPADTTTVSLLGLDATKGTPTTALASGPLFALSLSGPGEVSVRIGDQPPATAILPAPLTGVTEPIEAARALQAAIRSARPHSPAYSRAVVWPAVHAVVVSSGVPGTEVEFGPTVNDGVTVEQLGLTPSQVRYVDGVLSAKLTDLVGAPFSGSIACQQGLEPPISVALPSFTPSDASQLASRLGRRLGVAMVAYDDDRILAVPLPSLREEWSWFAVELADGQSVDLDADSAVLLANVTAASHGESIRDEVLGSADASVPFERFPLRKNPVTVLGGSGPTAASSLTVRVDGVAWTQVPTLYGHTPTDQVYVTQVADDGGTTVQFGDGALGARPLTGRDNVVATYRKGLGSEGRVPAHSLTNLLDRATGVKKVDNPLPGEGGTDPEVASGARTAAPGTVRTFGRAVSLRDFEDGALTHGEVAKARAAWVWTGHRRVVHLTVAGEGGSSFGASALARIGAVLDAERDVNRPLLLGAYNAVAVRLAARVSVDGRYLADEVLARVRASVLDEFSFEHRGFAASVHLSDLYAVMQANAGVVAIDIDVLDLKRSDPAFRKQHGVDDTMPQPSPRIQVLPAHWSDELKTVMPAELACLEDPNLDLELTSVGGGTT